MDEDVVGSRMTLIAEFTIPPEALPLGDLLTDRPEAEIEIERIIPGDATIFPFFWDGVLNRRTFLNMLTKSQHSPIFTNWRTWRTAPYTEPSDLRMPTSYRESMNSMEPSLRPLGHPNSGDSRSEHKTEPLSSSFRKYSKLTGFRLH